MTDPLDRLASLGRPRPLPEAMRTRLEDVLLGADARPLSDVQDASLAEALRDPVGELLAGLDASRPLPPRMRSRAEELLVRRPRRRPVALGTAVAAAAAGVLFLALPHDSRTPPSAADRPAASPSGQIGAGTVGTGSAGQAAETTGGGAPVAAPALPPVPASSPVPASGGVAAAFGPETPAPSSTPSATPSPAPRRAPTVDGLAPASGPAGTWVTLTGHDLTPTERVTFGGVRAAQVEQVSATQVRALAPAHPAGPVDVVLTTPAGSSAPRRFLYLPA